MRLKADSTEVMVILVAGILIGATAGRAKELAFLVDLIAVFSCLASALARALRSWRLLKESVKIGVG